MTNKRTSCLVGLHTRAGQFIGALVLGVSRVALDPFPRHIMCVGSRLLAVSTGLRSSQASLRAVFQPRFFQPMNPRGDTVFDIGTVGHNGQSLVGRSSASSAADCGHQFHLVVGGMGLAAVQLAGL